MRDLFWICGNISKQKYTYFDLEKVEFLGFVFVLLSLVLALNFVRMAGNKKMGQAGFEPTLLMMLATTLIYYHIKNEPIGG